MLVAGSRLLVAAALKAVRVRRAALVALVAVVALWRFYGPGAWALLTGEWFEVTAGHSTSVPWQQLVYQMMSTRFALFLMWRRQWSTEVRIAASWQC
jgi:hypothetical protein